MLGNQVVFAITNGSIDKDRVSKDAGLVICLTKPHTYNEHPAGYTLNANNFFVLTLQRQNKYKIKNIKRNIKRRYSKERISSNFGRQS